MSNLQIEESIFSIDPLVSDIDKLVTETGTGQDQEIEIEVSPPPLETPQVDTELVESVGTTVYFPLQKQHSLSISWGWSNVLLLLSLLGHLIHAVKLVTKVRHTPPVIPHEQTAMVTETEVQNVVERLDLFVRPGQVDKITDGTVLQLPDAVSQKVETLRQLQKELDELEDSSGSSSDSSASYRTEQEEAEEIPAQGFSVSMNVQDLANQRLTRSSTGASGSSSSVRVKLGLQSDLDLKSKRLDVLGAAKKANPEDVGIAMQFHRLNAEMSGAVAASGGLDALIKEQVREMKLDSDSDSVAESIEAPSVD